MVDYEIDSFIRICKMSVSCAATSQPSRTSGTSNASLSLNPFEENPRGFAMKRLLKAIKKQTETLKDKRLEDRGRGTMEDTITESQFVDIATTFFTQGTGEYS
jgi:hypothetical protein